MSTGIYALKVARKQKLSSVDDFANLCKLLPKMKNLRKRKCMDLALFSLGKRNFDEKRVKCQYPLGRKRIYDTDFGNYGIINDICYRRNTANVKLLRRAHQFSYENVLIIYFNASCEN